MQTTIALQLPESFPIKENVFNKLSELNPSLSLQMENRILTIKENEKQELKFSELDFFELHLPFKMSDEDMDKIGELNSMKIEFDREAIIINMSAMEIISLFTMAIAGSLYIWNKKMKLGRIMESQGEHTMTVNGEKIRRMPDISFHLHDKFREKITMTSRAGFPFLCIEIVSNRNALNQDLKKMEKDWMAGGTEIGLVVCPFREQYFQFEKTVSGYQTFTFSTSFSHPRLTELSLNFEELLKEAMEEVEEG